MKKAIYIFVFCAAFLIISVIWFITKGSDLNLMNLVSFGILSVIIAFSFFAGIKRIESAAKGEPAEDELSKKILQKAAAWSFYVSLYMWVLMIWLSDKLDLGRDVLLSSGILGMALIFGINWILVKFIGFKDE
jgi:peptidoglycan/LPS O-acetylase OafA/YrhL